MSVASKPIDTRILQELVPLNTLSAVRFSELVRNITIETVKAGYYVFRHGDRDNQSIYLLDGQINLIDAQGKFTTRVESGTDVSRYPLASEQPRSVSAHTATKAVIARIDSTLLDAYLSWDESCCAEAVSIDADNDQDWMTRLLRTDAFRKIPPAIIQRLLLKLRPVSFQAGEAVVRQGDKGAHFYCIHKGRCAVSRSSSGQGEAQLLAELSDGDTFGEEALVSDTVRNATVTMLTDGVLMRLDKADFIELLQNQFVRQVRYGEAAQMVEKGAVWVDVRLPEEYEQVALEDSVNITLAALRREIPELVFNAKYIICCDTGQRSAAAAFILSHKGFEVYVLEGGLDRVPANMLLQSDQSDSACIPGAEPDAVVSGPAAQDDEDHYREACRQLETLGTEFAELESENKTLRHEARVRIESDVRMEVQEAQIGQMRQELEKTSEQLLAMRARVQAGEGEKQSLQDSFAVIELAHTARVGELGAELEQHRNEAETLRAEIDRARQAYNSVQEQLDSVQAGQGATVAALQSELQQAGEQIESLKTNLASAQNEREALQQQRILAEQLRSDLQQSQQRNEALEASVSLLEEEHSASEVAHAGLAKQLELTETLRAELAQSQQRITELQAELDAASELVQSISDEKHAVISQQRDEVKGLQDKLEEARNRLEGEQSGGQELLERNRELQCSNDALESEIEVHREQLRHELDAAGSLSQSLEQVLEESRQDHGQTRNELTAAVADRDAAAASLQSLQQENVALLDVQRQLETRLQGQDEQIESQTAGKLSAEAALERIQAEHDANLAARGEDADKQNERIGELEALLAQAKESLHAEKNRLEEELQSLASRHGEEMEQQKQRQGELQAEFSQLSDELQAASATRDALQKELDAAGEDAASKQQEIDALNGQLAILEDAAGKERQQLSELLEIQEEQVCQAEMLGAEKDGQLEALREDARVRDENRARVELELETQRRRLEETQQEMLQMEERARADLQESRESLGKAHKDLTRKNDIERGLQGQIERLRKKLEQTGSDLQEARESGREDLEVLRTELNSERRARAEERAQMAARQRELKEQLAAVASEHEEYLTGQSGILEQAKDDAREEERAHLMGDLKAQEETEKQIAALREELERTNQEMAEAVRREKERYETDQNFAMERKDEADATITELEVQLKQVTRERDTAFEEQHALHEKLDSLRAEVEVARGLMAVCELGRVEDPASLRNELEEAKKDVEIAIRLRAEAELARDKALRESRELQRELNQHNPGTGSQQTSPFDDLRRDGASVLHLKEQKRLAELAARPSAQSLADVESELIVPAGDRVQHKKLVSVIALALVGLAFWYLLDYWSGISVSGKGQSLQMEPSANAGAALQSVHSVRHALPAPGVKPSADDGRTSRQQNPGQTATQPSKPVFTRPPAAKPDSDTAAVTQPATVSEDDTAAPAAPEPVLTAVRSFRDRLQNGSRGPLMVELPQAGFLMGSGSNSPRFDERPRHSVRLRGFSISKTEVTFSEYDRFARSTGRRLPHDEGWGRKDHPVINISWKDAVAYTRWLSAQTGKTYRLPSESEWEFAARGDTDTGYWWDTGSGEVQANCFNCGSPWDGSRTAPVGSFPANSFGLHDSAGNVQEWTQDCYHSGYDGAPADGSVWLEPGCTQRVVRGGAYSSPLGSLRSTRRGQLAQNTRLDNLGFRVVREP